MRGQPVFSIGHRALGAAAVGSLGVVLAVKQFKCAPAQPFEVMALCQSSDVASRSRVIAALSPRYRRVIAALSRVSDDAVEWCATATGVTPVRVGEL